MSSVSDPSASHSDEQSDPQITVLELYIRGRKAFRSIHDGDLSARDAQFEETLQGAIKDFQTILPYAESLFSPNDILEDIPTTHLKYIMTHYYLGFLVGQVMKPDRLRQVEQSKIHYMSFLKYCEYLDLLQKQDKDALLDDSKKDAATLRAEKLGRYQREKAANAKMEVILKREEEALKAAGGDPEMIENIGLEEEVVREFVLASIDMGVSKTIGELKMIEQEFEVLKMMAARPLPPSSQPPRGPQPSDKPITVQHIPKQGPPQVVNLSDRIKLQQQVFQPGHRLPTMTVDEYVHEEIQKRGILTGKGDEKKEEDEDSEDEEVSDRKTYKARSWDDWKDHNPRGAGNLKR